MGRRKRTLSRLIGRGFFVLGDSILMGVFLVGYLAATIHPRYFWWAELIAVFFPYLAAAVLVATVVVWITHRDRPARIALHMLLVVLVIVRFFEPERWFEQKPPMDGDLVLMTLNAPRYPETDEGADQIVQIVTRHRPALIGIQESVTFVSRHDPRTLRAQKKFERIIDELAYTSHLPGPVAPEERWVNWYQPVLATVPIISQRQIVYRYDERDIRPLRALRTEFEWQGRRAVHYNLHLHTHGDDKPWDEEEPRLVDPEFWRPYLRIARRGYLRRAWQAERIREDIERETLPVLIGGDFNATAHNWAFRHIARGFQDTWSKAGSGWGATFHTRLPIVRIDFLLAGPEWDVVSAVTPATGRLVSDHRPVIARLRWKAGPGGSARETGTATEGITEVISQPSRKHHGTTPS